MKYFHKWTFSHWICIELNDFTLWMISLSFVQYNSLLIGEFHHRIVNGTYHEDRNICLTIGIRLLFVTFIILFDRLAHGIYFIHFGLEFWIDSQHSFTGNSLYFFIIRETFASKTVDRVEFEIKVNNWTIWESFNSIARKRTRNICHSWFNDHLGHLFCF